MGLSHKAVLVSLHISQLSTNKFDREVSKDLLKRHNAKEGWARVTKRIFETSYFKPIKTINGEARTYFYEHTLPWGNDGKRILPSKEYPEFTKDMRAFQTKSENAVTTLFKRDIDKAIQEAKEALGSLAKDSDYPDKEEMKKSFTFEVDVVPIPDVGDFRTDLKKDEIDALEKANANKEQQRLKEAQRELWQRLYDVVAAMATKLADPGTVYRDTLIQNGVDLVKLLPKLNIADDQELIKMAKEVEGKLLSHDPEDLRVAQKGEIKRMSKRAKQARTKEAKKAWKKEQAEKLAKREEVAATANDILDKMAGYMGGAPQNGLNEKGE